MRVARAMRATDSDRGVPDGTSQGDGGEHMGRSSAENPDPTGGLTGHPLIWCDPVKLSSKHSFSSLLLMIMVQQQVRGCIDDDQSDIRGSSRMVMIRRELPLTSCAGQS